MHGGKQKGVEHPLVLGSFQSAKRVQRTPGLEHGMRTMHNRPSLKKDLIGIGLIEYREMNPVGAKLSNHDRPCLGQDSSGRDGAATDSAADLIDLQPTPRARKNELSFTIIDQPTRAANGASLSSMASDELPNRLMGTTASRCETSCRLVGRVPVLNQLERLLSE